MSFPKKLFGLERVLFFIMVAIAIMALIFGCKKQNDEQYAFAKANENTTTTSINEKPVRNLSQEWKDYWYAGEAEITSYSLKQSRYGEEREGTAALIYVTEDFLPEIQVKADARAESNIPVLKLNATKKFVTGIYPYSLMTSTFYPVKNEMHALKIAQSMQEWCGHTYTQLNNRSDFELVSHSYFQGEADIEKKLPKTYLENQVWTQLRIDPTQLPTGNFKMIPDFAYAAMKHKEIKPYEVTAILRPSSYTIEYLALQRTLVINFTQEFPHTIESWEENYPDTRTGEIRSTRAVKMKTIKSAYWGKNKNADSTLRQELGLL